MATTFIVSGSLFSVFPYKGLSLVCPITEAPQINDIYILHNQLDANKSLIFEVELTAKHNKGKRTMRVHMREILGTKDTAKDFVKIMQSDDADDGPKLVKSNKKLLVPVFPNCFDSIAKMSFVRNGDLRAQFLLATSNADVIILSVSKTRVLWNPLSLKTNQKYKKGQILGYATEENTQFQHKIVAKQDGTLDYLGRRNRVDPDDVVAIIEDKSWSLSQMVSYRFEDNRKERRTTVYCTGIRAIDGFTPLGRSDPLICKVDGKETTDQAYKILLNFADCLKVVLAPEEKKKAIELHIKKVPNVKAIYLTEEDALQIYSYAVRAAQYYKSQGIQVLLIVEDVDHLTKHIKSFHGDDRYSAFLSYALKGKNETLELRDENQETFNILSTVTVVGLFHQNVESQHIDERNLKALSKKRPMFVLWDFKKNSLLPFNFNYMLSRRREENLFALFADYNIQCYVTDLARIVEDSHFELAEKNKFKLTLMQEWMILMKKFFFLQKEDFSAEGKSFFFAKVMVIIYSKFMVMAELKKTLKQIDYDRILSVLNLLHDELNWNSEKTAQLKFYVLHVIDSVFSNPEPARRDDADKLNAELDVEVLSPKSLQRKKQQEARAKKPVNRKLF